MRSYDDDPEESEVNFSEEKFTKRMSTARHYLIKLEERSAVSPYAKPFAHFYSLWCVIALNLSEGDLAREVRQPLHVVHGKSGKACGRERS
jgi:hypothetical protein